MCQNGIYIISPDGQSIQTPVLNNFDLSNFEVELEFKVTALPSNPFGYSSVIMGGKFSRFIGIIVNNQNQVGLKFNNSNTVFSSSTYMLDTFHKGRIKYDYGVTELFLDDALIMTQNLPPLQPFLNDFEFTTTDFNNGQPFAGCIKNLVISSTKQSIFESGFE